MVSAGVGLASAAIFFTVGWFARPETETQKQERSFLLKMLLRARARGFKELHVISKWGFEVVADAVQRISLRMAA